ncbi:MAG: TonB-dependent receptor [Flavobacteriales bacterium]|nr:TonB-dependent receptor [Flavobacteriales bacterium]
MKKTLLFMAFAIIFIFSAKGQYDYRIYGYLSDSKTGEPLIGARIQLPDWQTETYTNNFGYFSISVPPQDFVIEYSFSGYQTGSDTVFIESDLKVNRKLKRKQVDEDLINDIKKSQSDITNPVSGKVDMPTELLKELPYLLSEPDVIKGLQSLPGITPGNEFGSNLYVRGGAADQNLVLMDGVPVYNGTHIFGLFSIFQPGVTNSVQVYKAGFPARYGGRVSSIIDINTNEGSDEEHQGEASIGLLMAKLSIEGPLGKKNKTTYSFGMRRTFWDVFTLGSTDETGGIFVVSDYNLKLKHRLGKKDVLLFSIYAGRDKYPSNFTDSFSSFSTEIRYGNLASNFRWTHIFNPKLFSNISITGTRYKVSYDYSESFFDSASSSSKTSTWSYKNGIGDLAVNADFEYSMNNNQFFRFGLQGINHFINPGYSVSTTSDNPNAPEESGRKLWAYSAELALYLEDEIKLSKKAKVNLGLRAVYFNNPDYQYKKIFYEPRVSGRYILKPDLALKASYTRMHQNVYLLTNAGIGIPFNFWVPATNKVPTQRSDQFNLGLSKELKNNYQLSIDAYYKNITNVLFATEDPAFIDNDLDWQTIIETGTSEGYGLEMLIQKNSGKITGWFGYTLAYANRKFENLNLGREFPFNYNRRHTFNLMLNYRFSGGNALLMNLTMASGRYFTVPGGKYLDIEGNTILDYTSLNNYKGPFFRRLDLGLMLNRRRTYHEWEHKMFITLYNALLARNPLNIYADFVPSSNGSGLGSYKLKKTSVPMFIPGFTYILKF